MPLSDVRAQRKTWYAERDLKVVVDGTGCFALTLTLGPESVNTDDIARLLLLPFSFDEEGND
jgi:hypothetical protein